METKRQKRAKKILILLILLCAILIGILIFLMRKNAQLELKLSFIDKIVEDNYLEDIDQDQLEEYVYKGYVAGLGDPYSAYYTKEEYEELNEENTGEYVGIGVAIGKDAQSGEFIFGEPYENSPAKKAGIQEGDVIQEIDGESVEGKELEDIISKMKGKKEITLHLTVLRREKTVELEVTTGEVEITTVKYELLDNRIGYLKLSQFLEISAEQFKAAYEDLKKQGASSLIVDLRDNPGGLLSEVIDIADYFLEEDQLIVYTKNKNGKGDEYKSSEEKLIDLPLVVLVNGDSASAAEILTGVIKDYGIGTIVGENTFGKGIVQRFFPLLDGSAVKLTVEKYYTPKGNDIHEKGIAPDIEVGEEQSDDSSEEKDVQLEKAISILEGE